MPSAPPGRVAHVPARAAFAFPVALSFPSAPLPRAAHAHVSPRCAASSGPGSGPGPGSAPNVRPKRAADNTGGKDRKRAAPGSAPGSEARSSGGGDDLDGGSELGDTLMDSPVLKSTLMSAMRDYFGDDGREVLDYMKRPRSGSSGGRPQFRLLLGGSGPGSLALARRLRSDNVAYGLYYVPDSGSVGDDDEARRDMSDEETELASLADPVRAETAPGDLPTALVAFARWALVDAVFLGRDAVAGEKARELERELADAGVTVFAPDVSEAIADGRLDAFDTLAPIAEAEGEQLSGEALLE